MVLKNPPSFRGAVPQAHRPLRPLRPGPAECEETGTPSIVIM